MSPTNTVLLVAMGLMLILAQTDWPRRFFAWRERRKFDETLSNELDHYCCCCEEGLRYMRETGSHGMDHPGDCTYDPRNQYRGSDDEDEC